MLMRKRLLAVVSLITILAMESVTVFATETGTGASTGGSPDTRALLTLDGNVLDGNAGTTGEVIQTTTEQKAIVETTATAKVEIKETKTNDDGSTTTILSSGTKDANGVDNTYEVTEKTDGKIEVVSTNTGKTNTFEIVDDRMIRNGNVTVQSTNHRERATIEPTEGAKFVEFTRNKLDEVLAKASDFSETITQTTGANVEAITTFDAENVKFDRQGYATFSYSESYDEMPHIVLHESNTGWERVESKAENGQIKVRSFTASPFIVMKLDKDVSGITTTEVDTDYTQPNASLTNGATGTVSGAVSPKTAEAEPYKAVAALALIAIAGAVICSRKLINK
jgi:hypothetical protein